MQKSTIRLGSDHAPARSHLDQYLRSQAARAQTPALLPLSHVTSCAAFKSIVTDQQLRPSACKILKKKILYLSYGGVHYRPRSQSTRDRHLLPVVFLFKPSTIDRIRFCYPFDTGAVRTDAFGADKRGVSWQERLEPIHKNYEVSMSARSAAPLLVSLLYGSNKRYLNGRPADHVHSNVKIRALSELLSAKVNDRGIDHRQHTIECHMKQPIPIDSRLLWVAYPRGIYERYYETLCDIVGEDVPEPCPYDPWKTNFDPQGETNAIAMKAASVIERFIRD